MALSCLIRRLKGSGPEPLVLPRIKSNGQQGLALAENTQKPRDFCIKVEDQTIHVHKSVLGAASDYFRTMLESDMKENADREIHIQDMRADVVQTMIGYFYGNETCIGWEEIKVYVDIVELWQITQVKPVLEAYIARNIPPQDCMDWLNFADTYHMEQVTLRIAELVNTHFTEISRGKGFQSVSLSDLIRFLSNKKIAHSSAILQLCIGWLRADEPSRKHDGSVILSHIRFNECNPAYLKHILKTYGDELITDQATQARIQEAITTSFILIVEQQYIFFINLASKTVYKIYELLYEAARWPSWAPLHHRLWHILWWKTKEIQ